MTEFKFDNNKPTKKNNQNYIYTKTNTITFYFTHQ